MATTWTDARRKKFLRTLKRTLREKRKLKRAGLIPAKAAKTHQQETPTSDAQIPNSALHYLHGEIRERIRAFAERIGVPVGPLTDRMGELLSGKTRKVPRS